MCLPASTNLRGGDNNPFAGVDMSDDLVQRATRFAEKQHEHQFRDDGTTPYVEHPKAVMQIVRDEFHEDDPDILAAALLHDTLEDTKTDFDEITEAFGKRVAKLVSVLSNDKRLPKARREREYFARLENGPRDAKICKLADVLHNLRDPTVTDRKKKLKTGRKLIKMFGSSGRLKEPVRLLKEEMSR